LLNPQKQNYSNLHEYKTIYKESYIQLVEGISIDYMKIEAFRDIGVSSCFIKPLHV